MIVLTLRYRLDPSHWITRNNEAKELGFATWRESMIDVLKDDLFGVLDDPHEFEIVSIRKEQQ